MIRKFSWPLAVLLTITSIGQIILAVLFFQQAKFESLQNIGWFSLFISAILGWLPQFTFKKHGGVAKGKSYMMTTQLVDRGIYSLVRHPQYLAGFFLAVGLVLITQHWASLVLGIMNCIQYYFSAVEEEKFLLEKFGAAYQDYMQRVPQFNIFSGFIRHLKH